MGISGRLKDVSVADVMQFIHLGRRTGTLVLLRGAQRAMIGFHSGRLVSAQAPRTPKLGDLLVSSGLLERSTLNDAISRQQTEPERRSLGQLLLAAGDISTESLRQVIAQQIEQAVSEVMVWDSGTFEFAIDDLRPIDDVALYPGDLLPDSDMNTQMVLLEAARIFDERNRNLGEGTGDTGARHPTSSAVPLLPEALRARGKDGADPLSDTRPPILPRPEWAGSRSTLPHLQVVSPDEEFSTVLATALRRHVAGVEHLPIDQAGGSAPGEPPPIVLVDVRHRGIALIEAAALRRSRPEATLIALVDAAVSFAKVYESGVLTTVPAEVDAVVACVDNLIRRQSAPAPASARRAHPEAQSGVARLRRVFGDLRSGLISATVALNLMHIISESVERAVLFLIKRDQLVALGAFGNDSAGRSLAELTRGMRLEAPPDSALARSMVSGDVQSLQYEDAALPPQFAEIIGRSRTGQVVVFPVLGAQRVISVIYADNGDRDEPIEDIDILELATAQVGMAFENELLRRQIPTSSD
jgi:hypothetical protein